MTSSGSGTRSTLDTIGLLATDDNLRRVLEESVKELGPGLRKHLFVASSRSLSRRRRPLARLLLVSWADDVDEGVCSRMREATSAWKGYYLFTGELAPESLPARLTLLRVQDEARLALVSARTEKEAAGHVRALVTRLGHAGEERVLHAWADRERLHLLTSRFRVLRLHFEALAALRGAPLEERRRFEIGYDGTYLWWPALDVHLTFDHLEASLSETAVLRRRQASREFNERYGRAIRAVRERSRLCQSDVEGLSERQLGRTERGEQRATARTLDALARAHGMTTSEYMDVVAEALPEPYGRES